MLIEMELFTWLVARRHLKLNTQLSFLMSFVLQNCINLDDCLKIICKTKNFKWKAERRSFTIDAFLNLADLQVAYGDTEITSVNISLYATAEIEDGRSNYVASLSNFDSKTEVLVKLRKQSEALGLAEIPTWVLILSASVGILLFLFVLVILIKVSILN